MIVAIAVGLLLGLAGFSVARWRAARGPRALARLPDGWAFRPFAGSPCRFCDRDGIGFLVSEAPILTVSVCGQLTCIRKAKQAMEDQQTARKREQAAADDAPIGPPKIALCECEFPKVTARQRTCRRCQKPVGRKRFIAIMRGRGRTKTLAGKKGRFRKVGDTYYEVRNGSWHRLGTEKQLAARNEAPGVRVKEKEVSRG